MDAILYRNIQMGAILHPGYHLYNRYTIKDVYSSTSRTITIYDDDPDPLYDPTAAVILSSIHQYAIMSSYAVNDDGLYEATKYTFLMWKNMSGINGRYIFLKKPSGNMISVGASLDAIANDIIGDCIGRINGIGTNVSKVWVDSIYARDRKLESQSRGEFADQIVSQDDLPSDGISGEYWYELVA